MSDLIATLEALSVGQPVAEEERDALSSYFVSTSFWRELLSGDVDVFYGPKGSGKSALYALLLEHVDELRDRGVLLIAGENPRGATAFSQMKKGELVSEREFEDIWRLYFLALIAAEMRRQDITSAAATSVVRAVEQAGLLEYERNLVGLVRSVRDWIGRYARPKSIEPGVDLDPGTGLPSRLSTKFTLDEPRDAERSGGAVSLASLLRTADEALAIANKQIWIALDRLDVAFSGADELERNGLRALLRVYRDMRELDAVYLKIFLRSDLQARLMEGGFVEATHLVRRTKLDWGHRSLLVNLVVRRLLVNPLVVERYEVVPADVLRDIERQESFLTRVFPRVPRLGDEEQLEGFDWILEYCRNGSTAAAPREIIQFLRAARQLQIQRLEVGYAAPSGGHLFEAEVFALALEQVSTLRLEDTIYAEFEKEAPFVQMLEAKPYELTLGQLSTIWDRPAEATHSIATGLVDLGVLRRVQGITDEPRFVIPPLYRPALRSIAPNHE